MKSNAPSRKVGVSALAAALTTVILSFLPEDPTPELKTAIVTIVTFAIGYLVPPSANDGVVTDDEGTGGGE